MNLLKKIFLPFPDQNNHQSEAYAHKSYVVRWTSRQGEYSSSTRPEAEIFPFKEDAEAFKAQLEAAFKLIRHTSGNKVTIEEA